MPNIVETAAVQPRLPKSWSPRQSETPAGRDQTGKQVARFLMIGSVSTATDLGLYYLFTHLGVLTVVAKGFSFAAGVVLGWLGNKFWTFESRRRNVAEPIGYLFLYGATFFVNILVNGLLLWELGPLLPDQWAKGIAVFFASGSCAVLNFLGLRFIVFAASIRAQEAASRDGFPAPSPATPA